MDAAEERVYNVLFGRELGLERADLALERPDAVFAALSVLRK